jgi:hypothetical protein
MIGLSVDYGRGMVIKVKLQGALDSALLAATTDKSGADRETVARNYLAASYNDGAAQISSSSFAYDSSAQTISGTAIAVLPASLSGFWRTSYDIKATSTVGIGGTTAVRALDIVMCIDSTGSMGNTLSAVQSNAMSFKTNLDSALLARGVPQFDQTRARAVYYKDYGGFGYMNLYGTSKSGTALGDAPPIRSSSFFDMAKDASKFSAFVSAESAGGGGDLPESGLECLNEAMNSQWTTVGTCLSNGKDVTEVYSIIAIYTDAGAHPPNFTWSVQNPNYPSSSNMPRDYAGLLARWNNSKIIPQSNKMILFYGDPTKEDDGIFHHTTGWKTVMTWPGFSNPGSLTSANTSFISSLASGISSSFSSSRLTN